MVNRENRKAWIVFVISLGIALISYGFLPASIPIHFSGGTADQFAGKIAIFLFPLLQAAVIALCETRLVKQWEMSGKMPKTKVQYDYIVFSVVLLILAVELGILIFSW